MARKLRIEVEGGLYHVSTRGNDRHDIFHSPADHQRKPVSGLRICDIREVNLFGFGFGVGEFAVRFELEPGVVVAAGDV